MASLTTTRRSTLFGLIAILFWSTTIAFSRSLTEQLGTLTAATLIYTFAGLIGLGYSAVQPGGLGKLSKLPGLYVFGCGALFVIYIAALYLAVGMAVSRVQVLVIGLINYLWPGLSLVFSIPILGRKARPLLPVGILLAVGGVWVSSLAEDPTISLNRLLQQNSGLNHGVLTPYEFLPYGLALLAAICWGLYSNLSRRWAAENDGGAVPLFLLTSGLLLGLARLFSPEVSTWSTGAVLELAYMALFPAMLAYVLWDIAVRKGEIILVASLSYLTPLLSTLISALVFNIKPGAPLWLGAGLVIAGAIICKASIVED